MNLPSRILALTICLAAIANAQIPIVFVHGNGDDATNWIPVIWMFESNGYPANKLFAIRLTDPSARRENNKPEPFHSSTTDQASELAGFVARVLLETKAPKVALVGSSRGGMTIRNYIKNAGGAAVVSHAVLCGTPNHGVLRTEMYLEGEFNGSGYFLKQLNEGSEVVRGVRFMTIRSDKQDKYAQANVGFDGPALRGAEENVVLPGLDHREVAFHPLAFAEMYRFITGAKPSRLTPAAEAEPALSGLITGFGGGTATNRPLAGVHLRVFALRPGSADRESAPLLDAVTNDTGAWGPIRVQPDRGYEFVLEKDGRSVTYFKSGLLRSTGLLNFRLWPRDALQALTGKGPEGLRLNVHRPQGYLSEGRDAVLMDGAPVEGLIPGVPTRDAVALKIPEDKKAGVRIQLRNEAVWARPAAQDNELAIVSLIWD